MDTNIATQATDELVTSPEAGLSRRTVLKKLGVGGLVVASAAALNPLGAEASHTHLSAASLRIDKSGADALVSIRYNLQLSRAALNEIRRGHRYGIWFTVFHADRSLGWDFNYDDETVLAWSSGPLPPQSPFNHGTSQRPRWTSIRGYGTEFYAQLRVFKREGARRTWVSPYISTSSIHI